jgi:hypothetical protein
MDRLEFPDFVKNNVIHEKNLNTWDFGNGRCHIPGGMLLSAAMLRSCSVAVGKESLSANGQRNMFTGCWPSSPEEHYSVLQFCGHAVLRSEKEL